MANTVDLSSLSEYIKSNSDQLFVKSTVGAKTLDYIDLLLNVKNKEKLNYLDSEVVLQGAQCGWNPQGSDVFSERYIEVHPIEVEKEFCYYDFQKTAIAEQMKFAAGRETLGSWEEKIANSNVEATKKAVEIMLWQGNSGASVTGFLADAETASAATVSFGSGATAVGKVDAMVAALPVDMLAKGDIRIFMGFGDFRSYIQELNGSCCANRGIIDANTEALDYLGDSRIKLVPVLGLEGTGKMVAATADALVYGTDIEGSETMYRWLWDEKESKYLLHIMFVGGTAIRFVDQVLVGA